MSWKPTLGAWPTHDGVGFRLWAPEVSSLELVVEHADGKRTARVSAADADGMRELVVEGARAGDRYGYRVDGQGPFPDPASRGQPDGVGGLSEIIDPCCFEWTDQDFTPPKLEELVVYELHVGTFTSEGTFSAVIEKLPHLVNLGVTAIELMPVGDFPGDRNWGYDGVAIFAPARCYGRPDDLRRLVNEAHQQGLAVLLDVVYNHFGPDGNYTGLYSPYYVSQKHKTPWGDSLNFDDRHSERVRAFFIENALYWIHEFHVDGLRLDATHAIRDDSKRHFLAQLTDEVKSACTDRPVVLIAEDHRNLAKMMQPTNQGGWGLDGVWADDFHHQNRRLLAGDSDGYFRDFTGTTRDLAKTIEQGWFYTGQYSMHLEENRGTDASSLSPPVFVTCLQNHDQVGNRAHGERLHHQIDLAAYRAAVALFLCCPQSPLLFMGQEWAATSPFLFFTDHNEQLGPLVTAGRREEFKRFKAFSDPRERERIPDPQAVATFARSKLDWREVESPPHQGILRLYQALLKLRREHPALRTAGRKDYRVTALSDSVIWLQRHSESGPSLCVVSRLRASGTIELPAGKAWQVVHTTEDPPYCHDPHPPTLEQAQSSTKLSTERPCAVIFESV